MRRKLPSLSALRTFEALARTLSFTKAAAELGVTQAAVSRQIKNLETELAVELVSRKSGKNSLTDAGDLLFGGVYKAFDTMEAVIDRITDSGGREILNVSVAPYFSSQWLTPRLMTFVRQHPEIDLRLHHSYHPADHRRENIDIGINWGSGVWPGVEKIKVLDGALAPVASPAFAASLNGALTPRNLIEKPLFYEFDLQHWRLWFETQGVTAPAMLKAQRLSDSHALRRAAIDGHGIALFFTSLIEEDVLAGRLVRLFEDAVHVGYDYYLNYSRDAELPRKAKAFRRFILAESGVS